MVFDAAEALFAKKGHDAMSLAEVGEEAGVSRGTPSCFFGSEKGPYRAVVGRMAGDARGPSAPLVRSLLDRRLEAQSRAVSGES